MSTNFVAAGPKHVAAGPKYVAAGPEYVTVGPKYVAMLRTLNIFKRLARWIFEIT